MKYTLLLKYLKVNSARSYCSRQADALYGSDENCEVAKSEGADMLSGTSKGVPLSDFQLSDKGHVIERCPKAHEPVVKKSKKERLTQGGRAS